MAAERVTALGLLLCVIGCAGPTAPFVDSDAPPLIERPGLEAQPDPVPRWEPPARAGNRSPYMVFGETYHVMSSSAGFVDEGNASWYGRKFHGRATSNGERYDMFALTAAHRSLPLPTWLRVTNLGNGRSTIVRVNDRGPFHEDRILDLSYGAAVKLGFADQGVAQVRIEAITPPRPGAPAPRPVPVVSEPSDLADAPGTIWVQAGAFGDPDAARRLGDVLAGVLGDAADRIRLDDALEGLVRVRVGPFADLAEANRMQALITFADVAGVPVIVRE
ncbi:MAG: septal ring lytic transglycosylase RlpA family protein [Pseudomonadales bacterium]|jgi:rare lipoprotein A|nr:septal ring lytic transglycosylase RlpA family protein [Pseudomonadales bacterium]